MDPSARCKVKRHGHWTVDSMVKVHGKGAMCGGRARGKVKEQKAE